eukprot:403338725
MIVFGSGGHTTEMLLMLKQLNFDKYDSITFVLGHSDTFSLNKIRDFFRKYRNIDLKIHQNEQIQSQEQSKDDTTKMKTVELGNKFRIVRLFRSREVKQSYMSSIITTIRGLLHSFKIIYECQPDLIVTNGPGTAMPLCYARWIMSKIFWIKPKAKILFIESFCRVTSLSLTGKLLKPIANKFVIQWEELKKLNKNAILYKEKLL